MYSEMYSVYFVDCDGKFIDACGFRSGSFVIKILVRGYADDKIKVKDMFLGQWRVKK